MNVLYWIIEPANGNQGRYGRTKSLKGRVIPCYRCPGTNTLEMSPRGSQSPKNDRNHFSFRILIVRTFQILKQR